MYPAQPPLASHPALLTFTSTWQEHTTERARAEEELRTQLADMRGEKGILEERVSGLDQAISTMRVQVQSSEDSHRAQVSEHAHERRVVTWRGSVSMRAPDIASQTQNVASVCFSVGVFCDAVRWSPDSSVGCIVSVLQMLNVRQCSAFEILHTSIAEPSAQRH